jgi:SAM-dependent methyltransferase
MTDWGVGGYERIAAGLLPAAIETVAVAAPGPGERVLDLGCGTGNAALLAAERGASVVGVDPAARLLELAAARAAEAGLEVRFELGDAAQVPLPDRSVEVVVSVFGIVFAADAQAAAGELGRVTSRGGRVVLTAWVPEGAIAEVSKLRGRVLAEHSPAGRASVPFAWHSHEALAALLGPRGFSVERLEERELGFAAGSPEEFLASELHDHPVWIGARERLPPQRMSELEAEALALLRAANEAPDAFGVGSRYVVACAKRREGQPAG